jgi:hypothetical protein
MNRYLLATWLSLFLCANTHAQSICSQVFGSAGNTLPPLGGYSISFTIGEPVSTTFANGTTTLTQGFHQPEKCIILSVSTQPEYDLGAFLVYPVPARDALQINWVTPLPEPLVAYVYNTFGQLIELHPVSTGKNGIFFQVTDWPTGTFLGQMRNLRGESVAQFKFIVQNE